MGFDTLCLKSDFDVARMQKDLHAVCENLKAVEHYGIYHDGRWKGISLISATGKSDVAYAMSFGPGEKTPALQYCPYIESVLEEFGFAISTARLLFLEPGGKIDKHTDELSWRDGLLRFHLPITTDQSITITLDGTEHHWKAGELWTGDFAKQHSVQNPSAVNRCHLVFDAYINKALLNYLPETLSSVIKAHSVKILDDFVDVDNKLLEKYSGIFSVPSALKLGLPLPLYGELKPGDGGLVFEIYGMPMVYHFKPISETIFVATNFTFDFSSVADGNFVLKRQIKDIPIRYVNNPGVILGAYASVLQKTGVLGLKMVGLVLKLLRSIKNLKPY